MSRRPVGKILLGLALGLVLLGLAAWAWIDAAAERRWTSMQKRIAELKAEARARDGRRPPREGLVPGDAWDDYLAALDLLSKDPAIEDTLPDFSPDPPDPAKVEALLDRNPRALELILRGARRETARHPDLREEELYSFELGSCRKLSGLGEVAARRLARAGRVREAADVLLALLQAGNDVRRDAIHSSDLTTEILHASAVRELAALRLSPAASRDVAREVERLEADHATCEEHLRNELPRFSAYFNDFKILSQLTAWQARRFGFSKRLMAAAAFERTEELLREAAGVDALPLARADALAAELRERAAAEGNLALAVLFPNILNDLRTYRLNLVRLRMLRAALHEKATGERLALQDPFGTTLRWSAPGAPLRIWSLGYNGTDEGGKDPADLVLTTP